MVFPYIRQAVRTFQSRQNFPRQLLLNFLLDPYSHSISVTLTLRIAFYDRNGSTREMLEVWKLTKLRLRLTLTPYPLYAKSVVNRKRCLTSLPLTDVKMTVIFH